MWINIFGFATALLSYSYIANMIRDGKVWTSDRVCWEKAEGQNVHNFYVNEKFTTRPRIPVENLWSVGRMAMYNIKFFMKKIHFLEKESLYT